MDLLSKLLTETYYLFHYSLGSGDSVASQKSRTCGQDYTIEEAFTIARALALEEFSRLSGELEKEGRYERESIRIHETEFGYDLVLDERVVSRYWIHPKRVLGA